MAAMTYPSAPLGCAAVEPKAPITLVSVSMGADTHLYRGVLVVLDGGGDGSVCIYGGGRFYVYGGGRFYVFDRLLGPLLLCVYRCLHHG